MSIPSKSDPDPWDKGLLVVDKDQGNTAAFMSPDKKALYGDGGG